MLVFANNSNGTQSQINVTGDMNKILMFITLYDGDDLGNDLILQDFVDGFTETGVIIEN